MTKYLISFPSGVMEVADGDWDNVVVESHAVIEEAKAAGVYVFGGGIEESVDPVRVAADGTVTDDTYPQTKKFDGGMTILELPDREAAIEWAAKIAKACRCKQELREFQYDEAS